MKYRIRTPKGVTVQRYVCYDEDDVDEMLERYASRVHQTTWVSLAKRGYTLQRIYPKTTWQV